MAVLSAATRCLPLLAATWRRRWCRARPVLVRGASVWPGSGWSAAGDAWIWLWIWPVVACRCSGCGLQVPTSSVRAVACVAGWASRLLGCDHGGAVRVGREAAAGVRGGCPRSDPGALRLPSVVARCRHLFAQSSACSGQAPGVAILHGFADGVHGGDVLPTWGAVVAGC